MTRLAPSGCLCLKFPGPDAGIQKASTTGIFLLEVCSRLESEIVSLLKPTAYNSFIDFCLALLPLSIVWNLNLNKRRKFALSILLSLGILYVIYKYLQIKTRPRGDANMALGRAFAPL